MRDYKSLKKIIIIVSFFILLAFSFIIFIVFEIKNKNQNIVKLENELVGHKSEIEYLNSIQNIVSDADTSIDQIDSTILKNDTEVKTIETIEDMALKNNLEVTTDSIAEDELSNTKDSGITSLKIRIKTTGSWSSTYKFISEMESFSYKIKIEKISLISSETGQISGKGATPSKIWQNVIEFRLLKFK